MRLVRKKRVLRKDMKKDILINAVEKLFFYLHHKIKIFKIGGLIAGGVILLLLFSILIISYIGRKKEQEFLAAKIAYFSQNADYKLVAKKFEEFYRKNRRHNKACLALFYEACCYSFTKDFDKARNLWKNFIKFYPKHILANCAYHNIGKTYEEEKRYREAIKTYREAQEKYPRTYLSPYYHLAISRCFAKLGKYTLAYKECADMIRKYPESSWVSDARYYAKIYKKKAKRL